MKSIKCKVNNNIIMKKCCFLMLSFFLALSGFAQQTITGTVTSSEDGLPVIGASIVVKGTSRGVSTNFDGAYTLSASRGQILVFSYVGMIPREETVGESNVINVTLEPSAEQLEEVVVTAMGVQTEKKKLNFAVQSVGADALTEGRQANFINGLLSSGFRPSRSDHRFLQPYNYYHQHQYIHEKPRHILWYLLEYLWLRRSISGYFFPISKLILLF